MTSGAVRFYVEDHLLLVSSADLEMPGASSQLGEENGLVQVFTDCVWIQTGIASGLIQVEAEFLDRAPREVEDGWDDIVEVSAELPQAGARLRTMEDLGPEDWPAVNEAGVGWYRLRVHCRNRDLYYDGATMEAREHHRVISWPAPPQPEIRHRLTDAVGRLYRGEGPPPKPAPDDEDGWDAEDDDEWEEDEDDEDEEDSNNDEPEPSPAAPALTLGSDPIRAFGGL